MFLPLSAQINLNKTEDLSVAQDTIVDVEFVEFDKGVLRFEEFKAKGVVAVQIAQGISKP